MDKQSEDFSYSAEISNQDKTLIQKGNYNEDGILEFDDSNASSFDKFFGITKYGSSIKTEIVAGLVTFLSMCYILALIPDMIGTSKNSFASIFIATAFGSIVGTLIMALFGKMPFGLGPGLGISSMINLLMAGVLVPGKEFSLGASLLLVFISGILFIIICLIPIGIEKETRTLLILREKIFDDMPDAIKKSMTVGIGFFIAFIGLQKSAIIIDNPSTLVTLVSLNTASSWKKGGPARTAIVAIFGLIIITVLSYLKIRAAIIFGILAATLLAWPLNVTSIDVLSNGENWKFWKNFEHYFKSPSNGGAFAAPFRDIKFPSGSTMTCIMMVITFCMIDMFDTIGTVVGCANNAGLADKRGKPIRYNRAMISDSAATVIGALFGCSSVTTFVESGSGIASGGKTGLTALTIAGFFFLSIFILPIFQFIPSAACASALIYVGVLMMSNVTDIDFKTPLNAAPAFITLLFMPLTYSITNGIEMGFIAYVVMNVISWLVEIILFKLNKIDHCPEWKITITLFIIFLLFIIYFFVPTSF